MSQVFANRAEAGRKLALALHRYTGRNDVVVLALPRGGVPVGYEVARALGADLDILIVRKLGVPHHPELAMGAIASGGAVYINPIVVNNSGISQWQVDAAKATAFEEVTRREHLYRGNRPPVRIRDRTVIIVDDGIATGATVRAAVTALRSEKPAAIVVAAPVAPDETLGELEEYVDDLVCLRHPEYFRAVGQFYQVFDPTSDAEVRELLAEFHDTATL